MNIKIEIFRLWVWNIGGFLVTVSLFLALLTWIWSWIINRLSGWHRREWRETLFYWIKNKEKIKEIIDKGDVGNKPSLKTKNTR